MKFQDIPQYTQDGHYRVDVPIRFLPKTIESYQEEYGLEMNPDFQRGHVWDESKQVAFVEHVLKGGQGSNEIRFNHPGWMSHFQDHMVLVDGLQRLTSILRFLNNEITAFGTYYQDFEDKLNSMVTMSFRVNDLRTRADVLRWYIQINAGGVPHTEEEISKVQDLLSQEVTQG